MPRFLISSDERWPDHYLLHPTRPEHERYAFTLSAEEYADYLRTCKEYDAWQVRLSEIGEEIHERNDR